jgi:hypothetical protein
MSAISVHPIMAPEDDGQPSLALLARVKESLTTRDVVLLNRLELVRRIDVDQLKSYDAPTLLWMVYFGLVGLEVDDGDRVFLTRRPDTRQVLR